MRNEIILAIISGIFFGMATILTKIALVPTQGFSIFSLQDWKIFLFSLPFLGLIIFNLLAVIFMWWGFSIGRAAVIVPLVTAIGVLISIIGALVFFKEQISILRAVGIIALTSGVIILRKF
jgi:uncharacterized membrane protein